MPRYFVSPQSLSADPVVLEGEDCRHIALALRQAVGDPVTLCDGMGHEARGHFSMITPARVEVEIEQRLDSRCELPLAVHLYQGNPKGDKLELIVQKAVELGVASVTPFESSRCIARIRAERADKQSARLSRIAQEAAGQCGRAVLPAVLPPLSFHAALQAAKESDLVLFCYEGECEQLLAPVLYAAKQDGIRSLALLIGPEGGFSQEEAAAAVAAGARPVSLGRRILRCETAPLYTLSCIGMVFEE